jgi:hypothetical protein
MNPIKTIEVWELKDGEDSLTVVLDNTGFHFTRTKKIGNRILKSETINSSWTEIIALLEGQKILL